MNSMLEIITLVVAVLFIISLATDPFESLAMDFIPERFRKMLRWILGILLLVLLGLTVLI